MKKIGRNFEKTLFQIEVTNVCYRIRTLFRNFRFVYGLSLKSLTEFSRDPVTLFCRLITLFYYLLAVYTVKCLIVWISGFYAAYSSREN